MKTEEEQPLSGSMRAVRWFYYASLAVGFPLWLLVTFVLVTWLRFTLWPLPDIGPVEFESPSAMQTGTLRAAGLVFFVVYPAAFFWAYRITRRPWLLFASLLLPVLTFCYAAAYFPITDSNSEEWAWLSYLGSLALVLTAGGIAASLSQRHQPASHEATTSAHNPRANKTDAGNGSYGISRVIDASPSPSPDPKRSPNQQATNEYNFPRIRFLLAWLCAVCVELFGGDTSPS